MPEIGSEIGVDRVLGDLLKTGQTTQYGGYEDDGYFEKGLSKRYTVLTAGDQAGTTSITLSDKTDLISNNCVYDQRTKLMWSRYPSDGLGHGGDGKLPWTTNADGEGVFALADAANAAALGGYSDWRIPNDLELPSIRDMEASSAVPDATAFPDWPTADYVFTSTTAPSNTAYANAIIFSGGHDFYVAKDSTAYAALVRGG